MTKFGEKSVFVLQLIFVTQSMILIFKIKWKHRVWSWDKVNGQVKVTNFSFLIKNSKTLEIQAPG